MEQRPSPLSNEDFASLLPWDLSPSIHDRHVSLMLLDQGHDNKMTPDETLSNHAQLRGGADEEACAKQHAFTVISIHTGGTRKAACQVTVLHVRQAHSKHIHANIYL